MKKALPILSALAIVAIGLIDILITTYHSRAGLFRDSYSGLLSFIVGKEEYTSGVLAAVVWIILAVGVFFFIDRISRPYYNNKKAVAEAFERKKLEEKRREEEEKRREEEARRNMRLQEAAERSKKLKGQKLEAQKVAQEERERYVQEKSQGIVSEWAIEYELRENERVAKEAAKITAKATDRAISAQREEARRAERAAISAKYNGVGMPKEKSAAGAMVKGAVVGKLIGGDAGAVVGAMVAKEKHDNKNKK